MLLRILFKLGFVKFKLGFETFKLGLCRNSICLKAISQRQVQENGYQELHLRLSKTPKQSKIGCRIRKVVIEVFASEPKFSFFIFKFSIWMLRIPIWIVLFAILNGKGINHSAVLIYVRFAVVDFPRSYDLIQLEATMLNTSYHPHLKMRSVNLCPL